MQHHGELVQNLQRRTETIQRQNDEPFAAAQKQMDERFVALRQQVNGRFAVVQKQMDEPFAALKQQTSEEFSKVRQAVAELLEAKGALNYSCSGFWTAWMWQRRSKKLKGVKKLLKPKRSRGKKLLLWLWLDINATKRNSTDIT